MPADRRRPALLVAAVLATPLLTVLSLRVTPTPGRAALLNLVNIVAAAAGAWLARRRAARYPNEAAGWHWCAAALGLEVVYLAYALVYIARHGEVPPYPTNIEALQIVILICAGVAFVSWARRSLPLRQQVRMALDGLIVATAVFMVTWFTALTWFDSGSSLAPSARALVIGDLAVISGVLGVAVYLAGLTPGGVTGPLGWLLAAVFATTILNTPMVGMRHPYFSGHPSDVLILLAMACVGVATLADEPLIADAGAVPPQSDVGLLIPSALLLVALAVGSWLIANPSPGGDPMLASLIVLAGSALLVRHQLAVRDVEVLSLRLEGDVAERTRDLATSRAALEQMQRLEAIGRMAGSVADDFRRIIVAMDRPVAALGATVPPGHPDAEAVTEIRAAAHRALALTDQLLTFARRQHVEPRVVDVNALLAESMPLLRQLAGKAVTVDLRVTTAPLPVFADPTQLVQLLSNLAVNGRDAMPAGGTLAITTRFRGPRAHLEVTDTGDGMDEDTMGHIFEPFYTTKPAGKGTGLGLATCYGIVSRAGGSIAVTSARGRGTTFEIDLPLAAGV